MTTKNSYLYYLKTIIIIFEFLSMFFPLFFSRLNRPLRCLPMKILFFILTAIRTSQHSLVGDPTIKLRTNDPDSLKTPEAALINVIIKSSEIIISIFCLTNRRITQALIDQAGAGTKIVIIADYQQALHASSTIQTLVSLPNITAYVVSSRTLHTKVLCAHYRNGKKILSMDPSIFQQMLPNT